MVVKGKTLARRALSGKNHDICVSSWEKGSHPMWVTAHRRTYGTSRTSGRRRTHRARGRPSRRTLNVAPGHKSMMRVSASRRRAQLEADASHQLTVWGSAVMRSWKKAKSGEVYDPAPKRSLPLNLAARRVKTVPDAPDGSGRWAFRGDEELVPQPPLVRISIDAAPREKRKQKCLWVSDNSRSILSRCWVLAGKEGCVRSTSALEPPPRSHYPHV